MHVQEVMQTHNLVNYSIINSHIFHLVFGLLKFLDIFFKKSELISGWISSTYLLTAPCTMTEKISTRWMSLAYRFGICLDSRRRRHVESVKWRWCFLLGDVLLLLGEFILWTKHITMIPTSLCDQLQGMIKKVWKGILLNIGLHETKKEQKITWKFISRSFIRILYELNPRPCWSHERNGTIISNRICWIVFLYFKFFNEFFKVKLNIKMNQVNK